MNLNFQHWVAHFNRSLAGPLLLPDKPTYYLDPEEFAAIKNSIRQFQAGENSDGGTFRRTAAKFLAKQAAISGHTDTTYNEAIALFIREEQGHSAMLGKFMAGQGIHPLEGHWTDHVFRQLRHIGGMEVLISVLLTAEIIAQVYYEALHNATCSPDLRQICKRILVDEAQHVRFQTEFLGKITAGRSAFLRGPVLLLRTILMIGTISIVWLEHKKTLRKGGFGLPSFFHAVMLAFYRAENLKRGWKQKPEPQTAGALKKYSLPSQIKI